jgi:hypothetical protein
MGANDVLMVMTKDVLTMMNWMFIGASLEKS